MLFELERLSQVKQHDENSCTLSKVLSVMEEPQRCLSRIGGASGAASKSTANLWRNQDVGFVRVSNSDRHLVGDKISAWTIVDEVGDCSMKCSRARSTGEYPVAET